jgi:hypothetical protein
MKWKIIMQKGETVKEGIITINSSMKKVAKIMESHGWKITYLVPVSEMLEDDNTQIINVGRV